jgi:saccharopine dehydrogenase-like NADP-dependent oxidoreductase
MKMLLVGAGAVGESILRILKTRDPKSEWLEKVIVADYDIERARSVCANLNVPGRFTPERVNAKDISAMVALIRKHGCDHVMDAAAPFIANNIFDAAFEGGAGYTSMGTWSVPLDSPKYGYGLENSFSLHMAEYNFKKHDDWAEKGLMACICLGIDPGVSDVFAKFAAEYLFDELKEVHIKDGGDMYNPGAGEDDVTFGFNVWTVLDECMNPNVEWSKSRGFLVEKPFAGREVFEMPSGVGPNVMVKVEHEEPVLMPRYLQQYGLERVTFKIALDDHLVNALKVIEVLGLRSMSAVDVGGVMVAPRDVVAAVAPQPKDIGDEMVGKMCVGVHCKGIKDGKHREIFMYQPFDNQESMKKWGMQAVVAQTGFGAAIGVELIGKGIWKGAGVFGPEYFDPVPYLKLMDEAGFEYHIIEMEAEYKEDEDRKMMRRCFAEAEARGEQRR